MDNEGSKGNRKRRQKLTPSTSRDDGLPSLNPPRRRSSTERAGSHWQRQRKEADDGLDELSLPLSQRFEAARSLARSSLDRQHFPGDAYSLSESAAPIPPFRRAITEPDNTSGVLKQPSFERRKTGNGGKIRKDKKSTVSFKSITAVREEQRRSSKHKRREKPTNPADTDTLSRTSEDTSAGDVKLPLPPWLFKIHSDEGQKEKSDEGQKEKSLMDQKYTDQSLSMMALAGSADGFSSPEMEAGEVLLTAAVTPVASSRTSSGKQNVSTGDRAPGAYEVHRRAPGYRPAWFRRAPVTPSVAPDYDSEYSEEEEESEGEEDFEEYIQLPFRWGLCIGVLSCVVLLVGLGLVVAVLITSGGGGKEPELPDDMPPPKANNVCDFTDMEQPDPLLQCACTDSIAILSASTRKRYQELKEGFIPTILPDLSLTIESCDPLNAALVWLAVDTDTRSKQLRSREWTVLRNRYVLVFLYALWEGDNWKENNLWLTSENECDWFGTSCIMDVLTELVLPQNNIHGTVPTELGLLTGLRVLDFSENFLEGYLPEEMYEATDLEQIILWTNSLEGTLSDKIGALTNLYILGIEENLFSGLLPVSMTNLEKIRWLLLTGNDFEGPLFDYVMRWPDIEAVEVRSNSLSGTIPTEIGSLSKLRILDISSNDIDGTLPSELGNMESMEYFEVDGHRLGGSIPTELGKWEKLSHITIMTGSLDGTIPSELGQLQLVEDLILASNGLTGVIPTHIGLCAQLRTLDVGRNRITGHVPSELGLLTNLHTIKVDGTKIKGTIPTEICSLREESLETFWIPCRPILHCEPAGCCNPICN